MKRSVSSWRHILFVGIVLIVVNKLLANVDGFYGVFGRLLTVLRPFFVGGFLAFLLYPPAYYLEEKLHTCSNHLIQRAARSIGVFSVYLALLVVFVLGAKVVWPAVASNAEQFLLELPYYYSRAIGLLEEYDIISESELLGRLQNFVSPDSMGKYFGYLSGFANSIVGILVGIVVSVYMLLEREMLIALGKRIVRATVKKSRQNQVLSYCGRAVRLFYSYFAGLGLDALVVGVISVLVFLLWGVPYGVLFGFLAGVFNLLPFFGPILAAGVVFLVTLLSAGLGKALWILAFQIALGQLDSHVIQPKIISDSVGITPFWVIFAVIVFGELWGVVGMIVGVPLVAVGRFLFVEWEEMKQIQENRTSD